MLFHPDFDEQSVLMMNIPECTALRLELLDRSGHRSKWECPRRTADGLYETDLRRFAGAAHIAGECRLIAVAVGPNDALARFMVAQIRPAGTCLDIRIEDGALVFHGLRIVDNLAAYIWWETAPWIAARELPVMDIRTPLPREFIKAGNLYVQLHIADMWVHHEPPTWPDESAFKVEQPGWRHDRNNGRERLSKYLALGGHAPTSEKTMPEIWTVLARVLDASEDVRAAQMRRDLLHVVSENPRTALETLGNSTIPISDLPSLIIHAELARRDFSANFTHNTLHTNPWVGCMIEIANLPSLFDRCRLVTTERTDTLNYLRQHGGDELIAILRTGSGGTPVAGCDGEIADDLTQLGESDVERLAAEMRRVPGAMLDADTRWSAIFEAFDQRSTWTGSYSSRGLLAEARHLEQELKEVAPVLHIAVKERIALFDHLEPVGSDWGAVPVFSLVLACLARLEAHEILTDAISPGLIEQWAKIAEWCPGLVATDLLLAEALVTFELHGVLISEPVDPPASRWVR